MRKLSLAIAAGLLAMAVPAQAGTLGCDPEEPCVVAAALPDGSIVVGVGDFTVADLKYNPLRRRYFAFNGAGRFDIRDRANPFDMVIDIADKLGGLNYDFLTPPAAPENVRRMGRQALGRTR